jgi:hypothetical protein
MIGVSPIAATSQSPSHRNRLPREHGAASLGPLRRQGPPGRTRTPTLHGNRGENPGVRPEVPPSKTLRPAMSRRASHYVRSALTRQAPFDAPDIVQRPSAEPPRPLLRLASTLPIPPWERPGLMPTIVTNDIAAMGGSGGSKDPGEPGPNGPSLEGYGQPAQSRGRTASKAASRFGSDGPPTRSAQRRAGDRSVPRKAGGGSVPRKAGDRSVPRRERRTRLSATQGPRRLSATQGPRRLSATQGPRRLSATQGRRPLSATQGRRPFGATQGAPDAVHKLTLEPAHMRTSVFPYPRGIQDRKRAGSLMDRSRILHRGGRKTRNAPLRAPRFSI